MTVRQDVLAAAERLTEQGRSPFSPAEVIAEARAAGSTYAKASLMTFIADTMCVNAPGVEGVRYPDLYRVGRGRYRLATMDEGASKSPPRAKVVPVIEQVAVAEPHEAWCWEGNVQAAVVRHLAGSGWHIRRVADTASREHGVDIEADLDGTQLVVEVKGYPSKVYAGGERAGQAKSGVGAQARTYFGNALLSGLLMRSERDDARVVLAFPAMETFRKLAERIHRPLMQIGIEVWLVSEAGEVLQLTRG